MSGSVKDASVPWHGMRTRRRWKEEALSVISAEGEGEGYKRRLRHAAPVSVPVIKELLDL